MILQLVEKRRRKIRTTAVITSSGNCRTFEEEPGKTGKAPGKTESGGSQKTA